MERVKFETQTTETIVSSLAISLFVALAACSSLEIENKWAASDYFDEFTNNSVCRVQQGTPQEREILRHINKTFFAYYFVVENYQHELRVGILSEPVIPVVGDVQIKVGDDLFSLGYQDAPLDIAPELNFTLPDDMPWLTPEMRSAIEQNTRNIQRIGSPYRHFIGDEAKNLLRVIVESKGPIKFRVIVINSALSTTATVSIDDEFWEALRDCGINSEGEINEHYKA